MEKIKWKEFEKNATQFLNNLYTEYDFITQGNSDSTAPDIVGWGKSCSKFYVLFRVTRSVRDGKLKKSKLIEYPYKYNFELLHNEGSYRIGHETFVAENEQNTVY